MSEKKRIVKITRRNKNRPKWVEFFTYGGDGPSSPMFVVTESIETGDIHLGCPLIVGEATVIPKDSPLYRHFRALLEDPEVA